MRRGVRWKAACFLLSQTLCCACGGGSDSGLATRVTPMGTGGGAPTCPFRPTCDCGNGLEGNPGCDANGHDTCDCSSCTAFTPPAEEPFVACGGRPIGQWRMTNWRYVGGAKIVQTHPVAGSSPITCDEDVTISTDPKTIDFLLDLQDGGSADATDLAMSGKVHFLHSCAKQIFSVDFCDLIELNGVACSDEGCGICTCDDSASLTGSDVASWSTMGTVLTLSLNSRGDVPYDYCLSGDSLTLRRGGIELDFERVKLGGAPQPCSSRTAASCTAGTGCYAGTCTGSTGCTNYVTEATCGVHAECTWQASGCGGFPRADCRLEDYGKVPGCDFLSLNAACGGTAKPCSQYSVTECTTVDGCSTTSSCQGPNWSCTDLCTIGFGCTDTGSGCVGTGSCNYSTGEGSCYSSYGCTWTTACGGLVPSCSSYSLTDCTTHPGCSITQ